MRRLGSLCEPADPEGTSIRLVPIYGDARTIPLEALKVSAETGLDAGLTHSHGCCVLQTALTKWLLSAIRGLFRRNVYEHAE